MGGQKLPKIKENFLLFGGVIGLGDAGLDHDGGVAALVVLGLVGDGSDDVTGGESEGGTKGGEGGDEYRNDDFDDLGFGHNGLIFFVDEGQYTQPIVPLIRFDKIR